MVKSKIISQRIQIKRTTDIQNYVEKLEQVKNGGSVNKRSIDVSKFDTAILVYMGDAHLGVKNCNLQSIIDTLEYVLNTPNARLILMGDFLNAAIKNSISSVYEDLEYPRQQWLIYVDLIKQIATQDKLDVSHLGNHERRFLKETGMDVGEQAMTAVGSVEAHAPYYAVTKYDLKSGSVMTVTHHGDGVNNIFGVKKLQDKDANSSINVIGHLHKYSVLARTIYITAKDGKTYKHYCLDIVVPSSGDGVYGGEKMYDEKQSGAGVIIETTVIKNPLYNPNSKAKVLEPEYIEVFRRIPLRRAANTEQKAKQISLIESVLNKSVTTDMLNEIEKKVAELNEIIDSYGEYLTDETMIALTKAYKKINKSPTSNPVLNKINITENAKKHATSKRKTKPANEVNKTNEAVILQEGE